MVSHVARLDCCTERISFIILTKILNNSGSFHYLALIVNQITREKAVEWIGFVIFR